MENKNLLSFAKVCFLIAVLAGLTEVLSGTGTRFGLWNFRIGLALLRWAAYAGLVASLISVIGCILAVRNKKDLIWAFSGFIIAVVVMIIPIHWYRTAKSVPPIHDITTDTSHPPEFKAILPLRKGALNSPDYPGPEIAKQQLYAYPDIETMFFNIPPAIAFDKALNIARKMGWTIIDSNQSEGRIEAVDTTFWFGFKDDIVIRIEKDDSGSRFDMRSLSRVGKSDVGTNAERIRRFMAKMAKATS